MHGSHGSLHKKGNPIEADIKKLDMLISLSNDTLKYKVNHTFGVNVS